MSGQLPAPFVASSIPSQIGGYWDSIRGMPRRAWDWSRRNKRWIIGGVAVTAAAVYWLRPYYQQFRELQSIVSEANRIMEEEGSGQQQGGEGKQQLKASKRQKEHHARVMAMANNLVLAGDSMERLSSWLKHAYDADIDKNIPNKLKALKAGPEMAREKQRLFSQLQMLCFSRLITALIVFHMILLTQRVTLSAGTARHYKTGEWRNKKEDDSSEERLPEQASSSDLNAELAAYLSEISDHLTSPLVLCMVDNASREACGQRLPSPTSREASSGIHSTIRNLTTAALRALFETGSEMPKSAVLLPAPVEENAEEGARELLVAETMDLVDSPHYTALLNESIGRASQQLSTYLCEALRLDDGSAMVALAKAIPHISKAVDGSVLGQSASNAYLIQFNELDCVVEFSDMIYYRTHAEGTSDDEQEATDLEAIMQALAKAVEEEPSAKAPGKAV
ncbi:hypothetical protein FOL47_007273 [Perkinsus chesapeaki]|uniref:Uncharacterized protein n=1 Tax=Perkinsus chesapeaki TaxID=330153 RepID=A0A7J6LLM3_PERCH|nr:hypothetical protein FOL47_007273 [Perkinsus chesapeaki]